MTTIALPARVTMNDARATLAQLQPLLQGADAPVIDASGMQTLDTAALALLLECRRQAASRQGAALQIIGASPKLVALARLYGVDAVLNLQ